MGLESWSNNIWQNLTACYGSDNRCSQYQIQCPRGQTIIMGDMMYAAKTDTQCQIGISDCNQTESVARCCTYDQNDKFTRFSAGNLSSLLDNCEGQNSCAGWAPRLSMFPYSSYVWIQYACVDENHLAELCTKQQVVGNNLFLKLNGSNTAIRHTETDSCSCLVTASNCDASIIVTIVDLNFPHSIQNASGLLQTPPSLHLYHANATFNYLNTQAYSVGTERMKRILINDNEEIFGLRNSYSNDYGPDYVMIHVATTLDTMTLNCYPQGQKARFSNHCDYSTTTDVSSTTEKTSTTPDITSTYEATQPNELDSTLPNSKSVSTTHQSKSATSTNLSPTTKEASHSTFDQTSLLHQTSELTDPLQETTESSTFAKTTVTTYPSVLQSSTFAKTAETTYPSTLQSSTSAVSPLSPLSSTSLSTSTVDEPITSTKPNISSEVTTDHQHHSTNTVNSQSITEENQVSFTRPSPSSDNVSQANHLETATSRSTDGLSNFETTPHGVDKVSTTFVHPTVNSTSSEQNEVIKETTKRQTGTVISVTGINHHTTVTTGDDDGSNDMIIGITVAVVVVVLVVIIVFVACFCIRLKRKETIRRNYIRNTNIFYSFPEDFNDTGSTNSDSLGVDARNLSFVPDDNEETRYSSTVNKSTTVRLDQYQIKNTKQNFPIHIYNKDATYSFDMPNDTSYTGETSTETIDFVDDKETVDDNFDNVTLQNTLKSVTFDPSVLYAKVNKEGRTKF